MTETLSFEEVISGFSRKVEDEILSFEDVTSNIQKSSIDEAANFFTSQPLPKEESLDVVGAFALRELSDLTLGVPDLIATTALNLPSPRNLLQNPFDPNFAENQRTLFEEIRSIDPRIEPGSEQAQAPQIGERVLPVPRTDEIVAGVGTAQQAISDVASGNVPQIPSTFDTELEAQQAEIARLEEQFPGASSTGKAIGTGLALFAGRAPIARQIQKTGARTRAQATPNLTDPSTAIAPLSKRVENSIENVLQSGPVKKLKRGTGRAAETGLEAGIISILNGGDRQEQGALAAGGAFGQAVGSAILQGSKEAFQLRRLPMTALGLFALGRLAQEFFPGEQNFFEAVDFAFDKLQFGFLLGSLAGALGAGRGRELNKNIPELGEFLTSIPRGSAIGAIVGMQEDENVAAVLNGVARDPKKFSPKARRALDRAIKKNTLKQTVNRLMKEDRGFIRAIEDSIPEVTF